MYRFKMCNRIKLVCFIKFIVQKMNSEMVTSEMVVLTERENVNVAKADVTRCCSNRPEREEGRKLTWSGRE
jgi:hypothetical protein